MARKSTYLHLKNKWLKKHTKLQKQLWNKHRNSLDWLQQSSKQFLVGSLGGLMMLANPATPAILAQIPSTTAQRQTPHITHTETQLITDLSKVLPTEVIPLTDDQEQVVGTILSDYFSAPAHASLEGKRLNRSYGLIGAEQHLARYPGDVVENMAPGLGAWGYFADSQNNLTQEDIQREQYYIAVQTFLAPGWSSDPTGYYNFFKYRKMLVVNPENGKAVIADIADAGPAEWTGKHLGGSPEVMSYLQRQDGAARGPVLYFFIDDPNNSIPLGPISIK